MFGVVEFAAALRDQCPAAHRFARHDQPRVLEPVGGAGGQRGVEQRGRDAPAPGRGVDHSGEFELGAAEPVAAEEAEQLIPVPPQPVVDLLFRTPAQDAPLQLQPAAVDGEDAPFEVGDGAQGYGGQTAGSFQHGSSRPHPSTEIPSITMSTFVLIPGAGGHGAYWDALVPELESRGHRAIAVDIEQNDPALGLPEYADIVEAAIDDATMTSSWSRSRWAGSPRRWWPPDARSR